MASPIKRVERRRAVSQAVFSVLLVFLAVVDEFGNSGWVWRSDLILSKAPLIGPNAHRESPSSCRRAAQQKK